MQLAFGLLALWVALALGQTSAVPPCSRDLASTDDCAAVIVPSACYNEYRFNRQTLQCIDGKDDTDRARKACKCCGCVGTQMCTWLTTQKLCSSGLGVGAS